ncbi:CoA-acylating methylmalonate-semialdehyde dehydrogenase [Salinicola acroporae]|uniref:methylmalonate-semialdehyde dehydrogenase (CoA acylating) n=1 Tax=Salinicola acroporae TaxID=1541440 RepID=A0ABT6I8M5_9GAMM|nr:CoA-acylating methylmalonate-semialdehyde dehydrogenase [Salinicola acroporae]MDH4574057.1 methylmalonate-semialdehyde dehydrogenase (CoA acylating) [Salinicola acroporae]
MSDTLTHFVDGKHAALDSTRTSPIFNPSTGQRSGEVLLASRADVERVIASSQAAFEQWSAFSPLKRARVLFNYKTLLEQHSDELARLISQEHGKVFSDAKGELTRGLEVVEFACGMPHLQKGEHSLNVGPGIDSFSLMQPLGVCAGITPFNFPAMVPLWMFPIAIAAGNSFVLKPSEKDPSATLRIAELFSEAGLPDGVLNVVNGDKEAVDTLLTDSRVQAVSFVGSTPIAEYVYATASAHGKRVQALGGAKNHMVVMPDADLDQAAVALMGAAYGSAGERCMAISVAVPVGEETAERLRDKLLEKLDGLRIGESLTDGADYDMGPLVSRGHLEKVSGYIEQGVQEGAELVRDGRQFQHDSDGFFIGGTLFDHVKPGMRIYDEEIFGPVLVIARAESFDAAVKMVNDHEFGNGTAIFTRDGDSARQYCEQIQVGMVGVNVPIPVPMAFHSFGGWKRSLFGALHVHGADGVRFYTRMKTVTARWPSGLRDATNQYTMPTL